MFRFNKNHFQFKINWWYLVCFAIALSDLYEYRISYDVSIAKVAYDLQIEDCIQGKPNPCM